MPQRAFFFAKMQDLLIESCRDEGDHVSAVYTRLKKEQKAARLNCYPRMIQWRLMIVNGRFESITMQR